MRYLSTLSLAAVIVICAAPIALAQDANVHPEIGTKPPRELLNSDLLALPKRERQAWVHGAVAMTAQVVAGNDADTSKCVMDWYFNGGNGQELLPEVIERYPDYPATAAIISVVRRVCPNV